MESRKITTDRAALMMIEVLYEKGLVNQATLDAIKNKLASGKANHDSGTAA